MAGKSAKRAALLATCWLNVASTVNPSRAIRSAGPSASRRERVPQRRRASCHVFGVPGTPTDRPLVTAWSNGIGVPFSTNRFAVAEAGAVSRPSTVDTLRVRAS